MPEPVQPTLLPRSTLVLGGARSGKSRYAEGLIEGSGLAALYVATAEPRDDEMRERIAAHRRRRGERWALLEEPLEVAAALRARARVERPILVDCLTLWVSNLMMAARDIRADIDALVTVLGDVAGPVVLVANEVGLGLVPETALGRDFRDHAGLLNQRVAALADRVVFMAAGLPLVLKGEG